MIDPEDFPLNGSRETRDNAEQKHAVLRLSAIFLYQSFVTKLQYHRISNNLHHGAYPSLAHRGPMAIDSGVERIVDVG